MNRGIASLGAGTFYLKLMHQSWTGDGSAIDDLMIWEENTINLSGVANGSDYTGLVTSTNAYGCPTAGMVIHKMSAGDTYTEAACESYRWINGTNYTTNQTNTAYTHSVTKNGTTCSVTDRLNLTISSDASTRYTHTANNAYTWPASGANGHGTGISYTESGSYIGPYYSNGACQSRDTLHLNIN